MTTNTTTTTPRTPRDVAELITAVMADLPDTDDPVSVAYARTQIAQLMNRRRMVDLSWAELLAVIAILAPDPPTP